MALRNHGDVSARGLEAERMLASASLASVRTTEHLSGLDRQALRVSKVPEFRNEVQAVLALSDSLYSEDINALRDSLGERIWLPPEPARLFELLILFRVVWTLEEARWTVSGIRLLRSGNRSLPTFELERDNHRILVSYQGVPSEMLATSRYAEMLTAFGIEGGMRRPDIVISSKGMKNDTHLIVEVKLTVDRAYIADSIYKTLGYLTDFAQVMDKSPMPQAVLVVWGGVHQPETETRYPLHILDHASVKAGQMVPFIEAIIDAGGEAERSS